MKREELEAELGRTIIKLEQARQTVNTFEQYGIQLTQKIKGLPQNDSVGKKQTTTKTKKKRV